jgi:hypothetical protein
MPSNLRKLLANLLVKTPVRIVLGLYLAYLLFFWLAFNPLVKWAAPKFIAEQSRHLLSIASARFNPFTLTLDVNGLHLAEADGKPLLDFEELTVDFSAGSLWRFAWTFDAVHLTAPHLNVALLEGGRLNWSGLIEAFQSKAPPAKEKSAGLPRMLIRDIVLKAGRIDLADRTVGFSTQLNPINFSLDELSSLPDDVGNHTLSATTALGARIRWKGEVGLKPVVASGDLAIDNVDLARLWPYVRERLPAMAPAAGVAALSLAYRAAWADQRLSLNLDRLAATLDQLALRGRDAKTPAIALDHLALQNGAFDLGRRRIDIGGIELKGGRIDLQRERDGSLNVGRWFAGPPAVAEASAATASAQPATVTAPAAEPWRIHLAAFNLDGLGVKLSDQTFITPLSVGVGNIQLGFSAHAEAGGGPLQAGVAGLKLVVSDVRLDSSLLKQPPFRLKSLAVSGGKADLATQTASLERVWLSGGEIVAGRDAQGRIPLADAFKPAVPAAAATQGAKGEGQAKPWHWQVAEAGLSGFQVRAVDEAVQPAGELTLAAIEASVKGLSDDFSKALPVKLALRVKQGGRFSASGQVVPGKPSADLKLQLADLALAPAQPYLAQAANLSLASGRASLEGRLKYAGRPDFKGGFTVDELLLNESEGGARFLAWKQLRGSQLSASDKHLNLEELKLQGLGAKLVIYQDKSLSLKKILKSAPADTPPAPASGRGAGGEAESAPLPPSADAARAPLPPAGEGQSVAAGEGKPDFVIGIERIGVEDGELDFADYSLALPFGTRIHHFKGHFNGIANRPGSVAQLELDGQVDDYGLARAVGQVDLFNATRFMDIKVVFRNVEMTNLTPYSATFAGRKIDSGKLSLDLEYKIKERQLLGENQVIMDKLTLGERVESPGAMNLPLDLAIAILQDSDGKIDLGLPVSGSLDDPQFSYGRIIWKAISNVIVKIATAPFRALASLFGGNAEKLEKVAFEAGEADLTPPEKEKFKTIAKILEKRPGLALSVHGAWNADIDRPVLKERQLRRAVAERMGIKLAAGEEPGPLSTANAKVQAALAELYAERYGKPEWASLEGKWKQANAEQKPGQDGQLMSRLKGLFKAKQEPLSAEDLARLKGIDLYALLYQRLLDREVVADAALQNLAAQRAQAVVASLAGLGAPAARVQVADSVALTGEGREVAMKLELGVAKK